MKSQWPQIAHLVWYYNKGRGTPIAGVVTGSNGSILDLTLWGKNSLVSVLISGIRHKDDPWLKDRPQRLIENGCWTFIDDEAPDKARNQLRDAYGLVEHIEKEFGSVEEFCELVRLLSNAPAPDGSKSDKPPAAGSRAFKDTNKATG